MVYDVDMLNKQTVIKMKTLNLTYNQFETLNHIAEDMSVSLGQYEVDHDGLEEVMVRFEEVKRSEDCAPTKTFTLSTNSDDVLRICRDYLGHPA